MTPFPMHPLEAWISRKIGSHPDRHLDAGVLARYQLAALNRTLSHVRHRSAFYRNHLSGAPKSLGCLNDLTRLPFTTDAQIRRSPLSFLCVSQARIARAVTLESSGTTGTPKRLFFTERDLALTVDFFHRGMATLAAPGDRVLILMPGRAPGSVGDLLVRALNRMGAHGIVHGPVGDPAAALQTALAERAEGMVGIPTQVLAMVCQDKNRQLAGRIQTVLLSADYVADAVVDRIEAAWGCRVFTHYGMTEMGLGGGLSCGPRRGYHFREADLLVEVVDPGTGRPLPDGHAGEVVFTTLTREGMPLVRYRTGDRASFRADACPCGTVLKTLEAVYGRFDDHIDVTGGKTLSTGELDEAVFRVETVRNYHARMDGADGMDRLTLRIDCFKGECFRTAAGQVQDAVMEVPAIRSAVARRRLSIRILPADTPMAVSTGAGKRTIQDFRRKG